jgi:hypothetical protein
VTPHDDLLTWCSEKGAGSVASLRAACDWTASVVGDGATGRRILDDLLVLGHLQVADSSWRVTPPVLSLLSDGGGNGLLVGARPAWFVRTMDDLDSHPSPDLQALADHVFDNTRIEQQGPSSWYFSCGPEAPLEAMEQLGVRVVNDLAGAALLTLVQRGPNRLMRTVRPGEIHARITSAGSPLSSGLTWEPATGDRTPGIYCYLRNGRRVFAERTGDGWWETDFLWAAWSTIPSHVRTLWFVLSSRRLFAPADLRLPLEVERILALRTGRLPRVGPDPKVTGKDAPVACYDNVSLAVAETVAKVMKKELQTR